MRLQFMAICAVGLLAACSSNSDVAPAQTGTPGMTSTAPMASAPVGSIVPGSEQDLQQNVGDTVHFAFDRADVNAESREILTRQARWMAQYPAVTITVEGHCDERGTREYNLALGERRANAVKNALVALGVNAGRVQTISYGKERPLVAGGDEAANAQNRRGVTVVN